MCSSGGFKGLYFLPSWSAASLTGVFVSRVHAITHTHYFACVCWGLCYCLLPLSSPSVRLMMTERVLVFVYIWVRIAFMIITVAPDYNTNVSLLIFGKKYFTGQFPPNASVILGTLLGKYDYFP